MEKYWNFSKIPFTSFQWQLFAVEFSDSSNICLSRFLHQTSSQFSLSDFTLHEMNSVSYICTLLCAKNGSWVLHITLSLTSAT